MLTMTYTTTDRNPVMEGSEDMDHYRVTLRDGVRRMTLTYSKGKGHDGEPPTLSEVVECLDLDASIVDACPTFRDYCAEYGAEEDSRKALRTYKATMRQAKRWRWLTGETVNA